LLLLLLLLLVSILQSTKYFAQLRKEKREWIRRCSRPDASDAADIDDFCLRFASFVVIFVVVVIVVAGLGEGSDVIAILVNK
jgi:hypothetical protein